MRKHKYDMKFLYVLNRFTFVRGEDLKLKIRRIFMFLFNMIIGKNIYAYKG